MEALKKLYTLGSTGVPVNERQMAEGENHLRPHFIQFNRCRNVLIEGVKVRNSPFWTIHPLLCENVIIRRIDVYAHGHNNDGVDPEATRNLLIEDCRFDQGDDAIAIKSGTNHDGWRLNTPTENVVIRNCTVINGHNSSRSAANCPAAYETSTCTIAALKRRRSRSTSSTSRPTAAAAASSKTSRWRTSKPRAPSSAC
jgi:polygalacturonase